MEVLRWFRSPNVSPGSSSIPKAKAPARKTPCGTPATPSKRLSSANSWLTIHRPQVQRIHHGQRPKSLITTSRPCHAKA